MNSENPYASASAKAVPPRELQKLASQMAVYRQSPPRFASLFLGWRALPLLLAYGIAFVGFVIWFGGGSDSLIVQYSPVVVVSMLIGASLRDIGTIRKFVRAWPAWSEIIDCKKVEELAN